MSGDLTGLCLYMNREDGQKKLGSTLKKVKVNMLRLHFSICTYSLYETKTQKIKIVVFDEIGTLECLFNE